MKTLDRETLAWAISILGAAAVIVSIALLLFTYVERRLTTPAEEKRVKAMEEAVKLDAQVSIELTAERDRLTADSMERSSKNKTVGNILIAGAIAFLIGINWLKSYQPKPVLPLEKLVALETTAAAPASPAVSRKRSTSDTTPEIDLEFVNRTVEREGTGPEAAIPILRAIQVHYGYLPDEALERVCNLTEITPAQIAGTSSFYAQFRRSPVGKHVVRICHGTACHVQGVVQVTDELHRYLSIPADADTDPDRMFTLDRVACLGCCSLAPVMMIDEQTVGRLTPTSACEALRAVESEGAG
jgi:NADH:ubiquinone oxidoreductase subunit E